jgi:hypothetical protein
MQRHARFLAKRGVNLIQYHGHGYICAGSKTNRTAGLHEVNESYRERIWQSVAANRAEGVVTVDLPQETMYLLLHESTGSDVVGRAASDARPPLE